mmetsp:Transcript_17593/g.22947  ORF Transcript_17593/g.22947 Transcript_17593/m.22947 type:complete len:116 (+) Transcript_17593:54-401(+)
MHLCIKMNVAMSIKLCLIMVCTDALLVSRRELCTFVGAVGTGCINDAARADPPQSLQSTDNLIPSPNSDLAKQMQALSGRPVIDPRSHGMPASSSATKKLSDSTNDSTTNKLFPK